ncbi:Tetratricopeptide repeat (TPR)-like superfamily protein [Zea mays]|uniref:Tetratricopeptide repeat (TPR)-like superfamily protein n=1 Tax=Zea mays TaxID=4577 RepID=A0A1D6M2Q3_MAIZE|nr:Tetratricopeptide repeat (TPR)-like superfamily protein [Zea mays]
MLHLKQKADSLDEVESILESVSHGTKLVELSNEDSMVDLTFNEDLDARPWWTPTSSVNFLSEPFDESSTPASYRAKMCKHKSNEKDGLKLKDVERKSLVPRLVYLSTHGCVSFLRRVQKCLSEQIAHSLEPWSRAGVMRRIVGAENETIAELMKICTSKLKLLASASASLSLVLH